MPTCHPLAGEPDPESLLTCPYEPSHRIARKRLQFHLTKCRKGHPNAKKEVCPFNATHMINEQEFQFHLETCPSKGIVDTFKYVTPNENHIIELPPEPVVPPNEENWDDDYCGTYVPALKVAEAPIIHSLIGGTRSERKECRARQRQKFRALDESLSSSIQQSKLVKEKRISSDDQPLRQPSSLPQYFPNNSTQPTSLNHSCSSGTSENGEPTCKLEKTSGVLNNKRRDIDLLKLRNSGLGVARAGNKPEPSQNREDQFICFEPKGRGKFRN